MLMPKRTKYRKSHRISYDGKAKGNTELQDEINGALAKLTDAQRQEMMGAAATRSASSIA